MRTSWLLMLCACSFKETSLVDGNPGDTPGDVPIGETCAGSDNGLAGRICLTPEDHAVQLDDVVLDTDADPLCEPAFNDVCLVASLTLFVTGNLRAIGSRPLVLWSAKSIEVPGAIDVHSSMDDLGAGANGADCPVLDGSETTAGTPDIGSGGCGGVFGTAGGNGGDGGNSTATTATSCTDQPLALDRVRGGCRGGHGGLSTGVGAANGGPSGGAVYLIAADRITITGLIDARGGGGRVAVANGNIVAGGGGGGSGGLIGFDAPAIELDFSRLVALGGGGSSGSAVMNALAIQGNVGFDPRINPPTDAQSSTQTMPNNSGGSSRQPGGNAASATVAGGGGGGGGGDGYIFAITQPSVDGAMILPTLTRP